MSRHTGEKVRRQIDRHTRLDREFKDKPGARSLLTARDERRLALLNGGWTPAEVAKGERVHAIGRTAIGLEPTQPRLDSIVCYVNRTQRSIDIKATTEATLKLANEAKDQRAISFLSAVLARITRRTSSRRAA